MKYLRSQTRLMNSNSIMIPRRQMIDTGESGSKTSRTRYPLIKLIKERRLQRRDRQLRISITVSQMTSLKIKDNGKIHSSQRINLIQRNYLQVENQQVRELRVELINLSLTLRNQSSQMPLHKTISLEMWWRPSSVLTMMEQRILSNQKCPTMFHSSSVFQVNHSLERRLRLRFSQVNMI